MLNKRPMQGLKVVSYIASAPLHAPATADQIAKKLEFSVSYVEGLLKDAKASQLIKCTSDRKFVGLGCGQRLRKRNAKTGRKALQPWSPIGTTLFEWMLGHGATVPYGIATQQFGWQTIRAGAQHIAEQNADELQAFAQSHHACGT